MQEESNMIQETSADLSLNMTLTRRRFVAGAGGVAALSIVRPEVAFGAGANSKIEIGVIGCGGRGSWIADLFEKHGGYKIVAAADYFKDRVNKFGEKFQVPEANRFT